MDQVVCDRCSSANGPDANYCSTCGAPLDRQSEDATESHPAVTVDDVGADEAPMIVVTRGPNAGSKLALTEPVTTIGRHPDSSVFLDDVTVSRRHAEIRREGGRFVASDAGSLNGTYLNGTRIESAELAEGDSLQVGRYKLIFVLGVTGSDD
jgi:hypothetical protein